jgi:sensor c-di-GMP phosphodiesterase-like protein
MDDRLFYPLMALAVAGMIVLAAVWPQGMGARSPGPFGHQPTQQTPEAKAALAREKARAAIRQAEAALEAQNADQAAAAARAAAEAREKLR